MFRSFGWIACAGIFLGATAMGEDKKVAPALNFSMKTLDGKPVELSKYQGKVVMFVNVASECGLTPQYEQLQALHQKYQSKGLAVVGVPCNQFGMQEPGSSEDIQQFCKKNYGVTFDLLSKVDVNGAEACDLYKHLKGQTTKPKGPGEIGWNFEKFLLNRRGEVVARFDPQTKPDAPEVIKAIETELAKK
jgi:glutathione peroxidase